MRIKEDFKKSGYFWLPSAPEKKYPGTLSISDGGIIDLEIVELFESIGSDSADQESVSWDILNWEPVFRNRFKRIVGHIETGEVTLDDCRPNGGFIFPTGLSKSILRVGRAFMGVKYNKDEIPRFKTLIFSVDGINEWIGTNSNRSNPPNPNYPLVYQGKTISFQHPEPISFNLPNEMELSITFSQKRSGSMNPREDKITQRTYFKLVSQDEHELDEFVSIVEKIMNFLCFAMGDIVCVDNIEAASEDPPPFPRPRGDCEYDRIGLLPINIFFSSQLYSKDRYRTGFRTLFGFDRIQNDAARVICNWINAHEEISPAFNLYFLATMGTQPSFEARFLTLMQGLEAYHRRTSNEKQMDGTEFKELVENLVEQCSKGKRNWLKGKLQYANELTLRNRIKRMIEPFVDIFGDEEKRRRLINRVIDTRNYLTHYDLSLESKASKGRDLEILCLKIEALFQLHFLQLIGFSREEINSIADRQLRRRLQF
ncbi:hypothetical protein C6496_10885 [Candidatus Poribacteria bacterium]|nr:MAG: hypothetical protein C6496_10885 [Candidatus Poribacteria bacterium]